MSIDEYWVQVQKQELKTMSNSGENYELFYIFFFDTLKLC
jgi:hypothetical protein